MNSRDAAIAKLQQLSPTDLQVVNELLDTLIAQQQSQEMKEQPLSEKWVAWFAEVNRLEVSPHSSQGDYQQHLYNKYRQQGLEL